MNLLLSNDDGVNAPGLGVLNKVLSKKYSPLVVAPLNERSTTGHSLSLDHPLRLETLTPSIYGCSGFPADCILMALGHLSEGRRPDLVISGINRGSNLGQDLYYSGTVAAAREASFHGIPSMAISLSFRGPDEFFHFETAAEFALECVNQGIAEMIPELSLVNINVPNLPLSQIKGVKFTKTGFKHYSEGIERRIDSRQRDYFWIEGSLRGHHQIGDTDCEAVAEGYISFTPQNLVDAYTRDFSALKELAHRLKDFGRGQK